MENVEFVPQSIEAERAVLGAVLIKSELAYDIVSRLERTDFCTAAHQYIYDALEELTKVGTVADMVTINEWLESNHKATMGTFEYLSGLAAGVISLSNLSAHIDIIRAKSKRRQLREACQRAAVDVSDPENDLDEITNRLCNAVYDVGKHKSDVKSLKMACSEAYVEIAEACEAKKAGRYLGLQTGFPKLDRQLAGLKRGELVVIGARSSIGKTSFALNIADYVQRRHKVLYFSLEMKSSQLALRLLAGQNRVSMNALRTGSLTGEALATVGNQIQKIGGNLFIADAFSQSTADIMAISQKMRREHGLDLIVVDYLQLIKRTEHRENEVLALDAITRQLKIIAGELDVPVLLLSQLSREADKGNAETRGGRLPGLSDLRGSGAIEQNADVVLLLHKQNREDTEATLIVAKQRNGATGKTLLNWNGETTRFTEADTLHRYHGATPFDEGRQTGA